MDIKQLYKSFVASMPKKWWAFFTIFLILSALGFSIHRFFTEGNYTNLYRSIFDPVGLFIGIFTFLISILITLKIQYNTDKDAELKQKILAGDNSFIKIKTNEIKTSIEVLLKQYQNIEVLNNFEVILEHLNLLYDITIQAEKGEKELNGKFDKIPMELKIMNHSASFGRLLCCDINVLKSYNEEFEEISKDANKLKDLLSEIRKEQKDVYIKMIEAFKSSVINENKYYITLSADKGIDGNKTEELEQVAYNIKYLKKLEVETKNSFYENFDSSKKFIQKVNGSFTEYLLKEKQQKQIIELSKACKVYDIYSGTIPFQVFLTKPVDDSIVNEQFYKCLLFFINDNTIAKDLHLSAISTSNIDFVKSISKVLDAERAMLNVFVPDNKQNVIVENE